MEEKIFEECLKRMKELHLSKQCIDAFKRGEIWESEGIGALYELDEDEKKIVEEFETNHPNYKVYHVIHNVTNIGELYNLLYVDTYTDEWAYFSNDLKMGITLAYVYNKDYEDCSEFGSIAIQQNIGGLIRRF